MIFAYTNFPICKRPVQGVLVAGIIIGATPRGFIGQPTFLPTPAAALGKIPIGISTNLTFGKTHAGHPRINTIQEDKELYLILSSRLTASTDGRGVIKVPRSQKPIITARAHVTGKYQRDNSWDEIVVAANPGDAFWVKWLDNDGEQYDKVYFVDQSLRVHHTESTELANYCRGRNIQPAQLNFTLATSSTSADSRLLKQEWRKI